jgi:arylsulfatase A-like enzyme
MTKFSSITQDWNSGEMVCAAPHTGGAFPAIFASTYAPRLYTEEGRVKPDYNTLLSVLSEDYNLGGFIGSNPILWRWSEYFNQWWNDGFSIEKSRNQSQTIYNKATRLAIQKPTVKTKYILQKADKWWDESSTPRFLWVHLMDPHAPYRPGLKGAVNAGLLRTYGHGVFNYFTDDNQNYEDTLPEWMKKQRKKLYEESVKRLDRVLSDWLKSYNDASIMIMGDHGEEFNHGLFSHARLYDETVKVPILSNDGLLVDNGELVRQIDISPRILSELNRDIPEKWEGQSSGQFQPQPMLGSMSKYNKYWVGIRSKEWKLIQSVDGSKGYLQMECYNVQSDPDEIDIISPEKAPNNIQEKFNHFKQRAEVKEYIGQKKGFTGKIGHKAEERLEQLGYK